MKLLAGNSNRPLAEAIAASLRVELTKATVHRFADMEVFVEIHENVRGEDVFIIQSTSYPANDNLMELLVIIDALRRASARRITAVMPYFGYARQDRKTTPAHADLGQARGQPADHRRRQPGADDGAARRADPGLLRHPGRQPVHHAAHGARHPRASRHGQHRHRLARRRRRHARAGLRQEARRRASPSSTSGASGQASPRSCNVIGDVAGTRCILVDDIVDSGGTLCNAADALLAAAPSRSRPT